MCKMKKCNSFIAKISFRNGAHRLWVPFLVNRGRHEYSEY
nr:MAG TPA: hypothetical protein [Bacteriophage sp.]